MYPSDRKDTKDHEWVKIDGPQARVGGNAGLGRHVAGAAKVFRQRGADDGGDEDVGERFGHSAAYRRVEAAGRSAQCRKVRCDGCGARTERRDAPLVDTRCPDCGRFWRPDIVWFGDMLTPSVLRASAEAIQGCQLLVSVGTAIPLYKVKGGG